MIARVYSGYHLSRTFKIFSRYCIVVSHNVKMETFNSVGGLHGIMRKRNFFNEKISIYSAGSVAGGFPAGIVISGGMGGMMH